MHRYVFKVFRVVEKFPNESVKGQLFKFQRNNPRLLWISIRSRWWIKIFGCTSSPVLIEPFGQKCVHLYLRQRYVYSRVHTLLSTRGGETDKKEERKRRKEWVDDRTWSSIELATESGVFTMRTMCWYSRSWETSSHDRALVFYDVKHYRDRHARHSVTHRAWGSLARPFFYFHSFSFSPSLVLSFFPLHGSSFSAETRGYGPWAWARVHLAPH